MSKQICIFPFLAIASMVSLTSTAAYGQWYAGAGVNRGFATGAAAGYGLGAAYGGYGYGGGWGAASDPVSNYTNAVYSGMSNLIRSQGQYNEQTTRAMINYQQARDLYIDNQQKALSARQSMNRQLAAQHAADTEAAHAALARADEFIAAHRPLPLSNSQLSPSTGKIDWPLALTAPEFADSRKALEGLFEARSKYGVTASNASQIETKTAELKDALREHITKMPLKDYSEARRFLDSMYASAR